MRDRLFPAQLRIDHPAGLHFAQVPHTAGSGHQQHGSVPHATGKVDGKSVPFVDLFQQLRDGLKLLFSRHPCCPALRSPPAVLPGCPPCATHRGNIPAWCRCCRPAFPPQLFCAPSRCTVPECSPGSPFPLSGTAPRPRWSGSCSSGFSGLIYKSKTSRPILSILLFRFHLHQFLLPCFAPLRYRRPAHTKKFCHGLILRRVAPRSSRAWSAAHSSALGA